MRVDRSEEDTQCDSSTNRFSLLRQPDLSHPAYTEPVNQTVRTDGLGFSCRVGHRGGPGTLGESAGIGMGGEKRFSFGP